tara:strand:+ start:270 stop:509 length:240 start_codon:yes stop_codon:yes gene_type:complete
MSKIDKEKVELLGKETMDFLNEQQKVLESYIRALKSGIDIPDIDKKMDEIEKERDQKIEEFENQMDYFEEKDEQEQKDN